MTSLSAEVNKSFLERLQCLAGCSPARHKGRSLGGEGFTLLADGIGTKMSFEGLLKIEFALIAVTT